MTRRIIHHIALIGMLALPLFNLIPGVWLNKVLAQNDAETFVNTTLGIAFDLPTGWDVQTETNALTAGAPSDVQAVLNGDVPQNLVLRVVVGSFNELGLVDASGLPDLLVKFVPPGTSATAVMPATCGNCEGYQTLAVVPSTGLTTQIALFSIAGGRIAVVRGLAPSGLWDASGRLQFESLLSTLIFSTPERSAESLATITLDDGGVFWQYSAPQPTDRVVNAGGITYDGFGIMYMAVGPAGILSLDMAKGESISFMGPWVDGNYVDVALGPDMLLYLANASSQPGDAITVVDRAGNYYRGWGTRGDGDGQFAPGMPRTIAVTRAGEVWAVSEGHLSGITNRLYKFDAFGNLLLTSDLSTINPDLAQIRIDNNLDTNTLYVTGTTGSINIVDANGQVLVRNLAQDILAGMTPTDIAVAPNGNLIVTLAAPGFETFGFLEISTSGSLLDAFGVPYDTNRGGPFLPGEYQRPAGIVAGANDKVYATETDAVLGTTQVMSFSFRGDGGLPAGGQTVSEVPSNDGMAPDPAAGGGVINYGTTVRGALNNRNPVHEWRFTGSAGDRVTITMVDASGEGALDPMLYLESAAGVELGQNDDVGASAPEGVGPRDAVVIFDLPTSGEYVISATRFGGRGEYRLTLEVSQ